MNCVGSESDCSLRIPVMLASLQFYAHPPDIHPWFFLVTRGHQQI